MKNTVVTFKQAKEKGERISMLTAYDYSTAKYIDWNNRKDSYVGAYCVYTIPSATAGKTFVVFQLFQRMMIIS